MVAEYEGICLDAAYDLPVIQALNDLSYLKEKQGWEREQSRRVLNKV